MSLRDEIPCPKCGHPQIPFSFCYVCGYEWNPRHEHIKLGGLDNCKICTELIKKEIEKQFKEIIESAIKKLKEEKDGTDEWKSGC